MRAVPPRRNWHTSPIGATSRLARRELCEAVCRQARRGVLQAAYARNPQRFVNGTPEPPALEPTVFINPPEPIAA